MDLRELFSKFFIKGNTIQTLRDKIILNAGPKINRLVFDIDGTTNSFVNSLIASLKGWGIPATPTLLGPFRNWLYPKIFRSNNVINATLISTGKTKKINLKTILIEKSRKGTFIINA